MPNWSRIFPIDHDGTPWREAFYRAYASMWPQIWLTGILLVLCIIFILLGWI